MDAPTIVEDGQKPGAKKMNGTETLVLVDGSSLAYRSFYALLTTAMRTKTGVPTWAVMGFFNSLFDMIDRQAPHMLAVCFDLKGPTFRHEEFTEYKAHRQEMPDDLAVQWPLIKRGLTALGIPVLEIAGFEADDVIGTIAVHAAKEGRKVTILTGDQDTFQLIDPDDVALIDVLMPSKTGLMSYRRQQVYDKLGVWPEQIIDYKGLCGDTSDNIPGIRGIGPKTAQKLLSDYQTIEGIYEHVEEITSKSLKAKLIEGKDSAFASKRLATIVLDVPVEFTLESCRLTMPDVECIGKFFRSLQFRGLVSRLPMALAKSFSDEPDKQALEKKLKTIVNAIDVPPINFSDIHGEGVEMSITVVSESTQLQLTDISMESDSSASSIPTPLAAPAPVVVPAFANPPAPIMVTNESALNDLIEELSKSEIISVAVETDSPNALESAIIGWSFAWGNGIHLQEDRTLSVEPENGNYELKTAYIPVRHQSLGVEQMEPDLVAAKLKPILEGSETAKIVHNAKAVMNVLSLIDIELENIVFDPMLASYIRNPDDRHSLFEQCDRIFNYNLTSITDITGTGKKQVTAAVLPIERVSVFLADAARVSFELARYYAAIFDEEQTYLLYQMELPVSRVLAHMEQYGVALDREYLRKLNDELITELTQLEKDIYELAGHSFNISSTQQLQKVLFEELGLQSKAKTKSGMNLSTDASVLESIKDSHVIIQKIIDYRHMTKLRGTYVEALPKQISERDARLHGEFNQTVTSTGRLSSSNPNLQNIPIRTEIGRKIRRAFVAKDSGSSLISADYSQIELRMLAHMSGDETLIDAFQKNQDIHNRTAGEIFGVPIEQVDSDMRRVAKTLNFALIYQQGPFATAQDLGITIREAKAFIEKYFATYPKVKTFMTQTIQDAKTYNFVSTLWGRKRYFAHLQDRNNSVRSADERAACNAPLQGSAADLMKLAMLKLDERLKESGSKAKLVLQVHDELVLEVPDDELDAAAEIVRESMELDQPLKVPLKVDTGKGKTWIDAK